MAIEQDFPTIRFGARESIEMPFRPCRPLFVPRARNAHSSLGYIMEHGGPVLPAGMRELLHRDLDKSFEL